MRFALTPDQLELADGAAALLRARCTPDAVRTAWASPTGEIDGLWDELAELGLLGVMTPESAGGLGLGAVELVAVLREAGYVAAPGPLVETALVAPAVLAQAAASPAAQRLASIAQGTPGAHGKHGAQAEHGKHGAQAEQGKHGAQAEQGTQAEQRVAATYQPDGRAEAPLVVPYAGIADAVLVAHRDGRLELLTGLSTTPVATVDESRGAVHITAAAERAELTAGTGAPLGGTALALGALGTSAQLVGLAQRCVDLAVEYAQQRQQFGAPIGSFQAVKHHLANAKLAVAFAWPTVLEAAAAFDHGRPTWQRSASAAKVLTSQAAQRVSELTLQTHGAIGYTVEYDLHLYLKRAWALSRSWGTTADHLEHVAAAVLDA